MLRVRSAPAEDLPLADLPDLPEEAFSEDALEAAASVGAGSSLRAETRFVRETPPLGLTPGAAPLAGPGASALSNEYEAHLGE